MRDNIVHAFLALFSVFFIGGSHAKPWLFVPGNVVLSAIEGNEAELDSLDPESLGFLLDIYTQKQEWFMVEWPFVVEFPLFYIVWSLAGLGIVTFIAGLRLFPLPRIIFPVCGLLWFLVLVAFFIEISRGSHVLGGFWLALLGGSGIVYSSLKVSCQKGGPRY